MVVSNTGTLLKAFREAKLGDIFNESNLLEKLEANEPVQIGERFVLINIGAWIVLTRHVRCLIVL